MWDTIKRAVLGTVSSIGRLVSGAGSALFGTDNFLKYVYRSTDNFYTHPVSITAVTFNVIVNCLTRIPELFRGSRDKNLELDEQVLQKIIDTELANFNSDEEVFSDSANAEEENQQASRYSCLFKTIAYLSNAISITAVSLGSYNNGKMFCSFIAAQMDESLEDEDWKYYTVLLVAFYVAASNAHVFSTYVGKKVHSNLEDLNHLIANKKLSDINKRRVTTAFLISSLTLITNTTFNYLSSKKGLAGINEDIQNFPATEVPEYVQIPDWLITIIAGSFGAAGFVADLITLLPSLYKDLEEIEKSCQPPDDESSDPCWKTVMKAVSYPIGLVDSALGAAQGHTSIVLTMHEMLGVDPYGYIINFGFICAMSKLMCQFSFNFKKGVNDFMDHIECQKRPAPFTLFNASGQLDSSADIFRSQEGRLTYEEESSYDYSDSESSVAAILLA